MRNLCEPDNKLGSAAEVMLKADAHALEAGTSETLQGVGFGVHPAGNRLAGAKVKDRLDSLNVGLGIGKVQPLRPIVYDRSTPSPVYPAVAVVSARSPSATVLVAVSFRPSEPRCM